MTDKVDNITRGARAGLPEGFRAAPARSHWPAIVGALSLLVAGAQMTLAGLNFKNLSGLETYRALLVTGYRLPDAVLQLAFPVLLALIGLAMLVRAPRTRAITVFWAWMQLGAAGITALPLFHMLVGMFGPGAIVGATVVGLVLLIYNGGWAGFLLLWLRRASIKSEMASWRGQRTGGDPAARRWHHEA
jgi:hypothetical protein